MWHVKFGENGQCVFAEHWCMEIMDFLLILSYHVIFLITAGNWKGQTFSKKVNIVHVRNMQENSFVKSLFYKPLVENPIIFSLLTRFILELIPHPGHR